MCFANTNVVFLPPLPLLPLLLLLLLLLMPDKVNDVTNFKWQSQLKPTIREHGTRSLGYIILKWFISGCTPLTLYTILIISQLLTHILLYIYILFFKNLS